MINIVFLKKWVDSTLLDIEKLSLTDEKVEKLASKKWQNCYIDIAGKFFQKIKWGCWDPSIGADNALQEKIMQVMELVQGESDPSIHFRGKIEGVMQRAQYELPNLAKTPYFSWLINEITKKIQAKIQANNFELEDFFERGIWIPLLLKKYIIQNVIAELRITNLCALGQDRALAVFTLLGTASGSAVGETLIRLERTKQFLLPNESMQDLVKTCILSSGLSFLPYLQNFFPNAEEEKEVLVSLVLEMIATSPREEPLAFSRKEVLAYLSFWHLDENQLLLGNIDKFFQVTEAEKESLPQLAEEAKNLFKLHHANSGVLSYPMLLKRAIAKLQASPEKKEVHRLKKEIANKFLTEKKWGHLAKRGIFFLENLSLFEFDEIEKVKILKKANHYHYYEQIIQILITLPWSRIKERLVLRMARDKTCAHILPFLDKLGFDAQSPVNNTIEQFVIRNFLNKKISIIENTLEHALGFTLFVKIPPDLFLSPYFGKLKPLFSLACAVAPILIDIPVTVDCYAPDFHKQYLEAISTLDKREPGFGKALSILIKNSGAEKIIRQMSSIGKAENDIDQIKLKQLAHALHPLAFDEIFLTYLTLLSHEFDKNPEKSNRKKEISVNILTQGILSAANAFRKDAKVSNGWITQFCLFIRDEKPVVDIPSLHRDSPFAAIFPFLFFQLLLASEKSEESQFYKAALFFITEHAEWIKGHLPPSLCKEIAKHATIWHSSKSFMLLKRGNPYARNPIAFLFNQTQLMMQNELSIEKVELSLKMILFSFTILYSDKTTKSTTAEEVFSEDIDFFFNKMIDFISLKFQLQKEEREELIAILMQWEDPHFLMEYYYQHEKEPDIINPFINWFQALVRKKLPSLRFEEGEQGKYFAQFNPSLVEWHKEEMEIDKNKLREIWDIGTTQSVEVAECINYFRQNFPQLFVWENVSWQWEELDLKEKLFWQQQIREIKDRYKKELPKQNSEIARWKLLWNLIQLQKEESPRKCLLLLQALQDFMGSYRKKRAEFNEGLYNQLNQLITQLQGKLQGRIDHPLNRIHLRCTHSPQLAFNISNVTLGSCQSIHDPSYNKSLIGRLVHGKQKIFIVEDPLTGQPLAIATVKLLIDPRSGTPALLREPVYQCRGCSLSTNQLEEIVTLALAVECEKKNIPLFIAKVGGNIHYWEAHQSPLLLASRGVAPLLSKTGGIPEYEDANRMKIQLSSEYLIPKEFLIRIETRLVSNGLVA